MGAVSSSPSELDVQELEAMCQAAGVGLALVPFFRDLHVKRNFALLPRVLHCSKEC